MEIIDNINRLLGDDMQQTVQPNSRLKIAASYFSIFAFEALKKELSSIDELQFIFTSPTFMPSEVTDKVKKERRQFVLQTNPAEHSINGTAFEIQLRNKLTQKAIAKECAQWIRKKATFKSNKTQAPMQPFAAVQNNGQDTVYMPIQGFTAVDLGYQQGNAISNIVNKFTETPFTNTYLSLFDQLWHDQSKLEDVTEQICQQIDSVYQENAPERIYFFMLYNIFKDFLDEMDEDVLPNDRTGYLDTLIWNKLFNYQKDAATGIINKLETYNGCILADSVGLGKTFTALAVIKYYELRNKSVLVLCPKKLADNWRNYNQNLTTNPFIKDRFSFDVLCHTDLSRTSGESFGMPLNRVNWANYDLVVIDESHNFRNNDALKDRETRYQKLLNKVIRQGVKTKVLMLSATPVNNRFTDLRNQLALAYEGDSTNLTKLLKTESSIEDIFRKAQAAFNLWSKLPAEQRTAKAILDALDFDFFEVLDAVTIARSRKHIQTFYDTTDIGRFPDRRKPLSFHCALTKRPDVMGFNDIFQQLSLLQLSVYAPISYILPSRLQKYEEMYDTEVEGGKGKLRQQDREKSLQALMTTNLLKRLESSVYAFRLTLQNLQSTIDATLDKIDEFERNGNVMGVDDWTSSLESIEADDDDFAALSDDNTIGGKIKINLADMDVLSWKHDLMADKQLIEALIHDMNKITPEDDLKLQHIKAHILHKVNNPINPGNRKVIVFTAFADTADYLYEHLAPSLLSLDIHSGKVTGKSTPKTTSKKGYDFQEILTLFSPKSKDKDKVLPKEPHEIDLLIGTDCISEGQNLQDGDYLINFDIHWNPVRIIQRFGRIDRIGSINQTIQLVNYWPDISLDEYINLKERVESRMTIVDVAATGDDNVLSSQSNDVAYRKEQLRRLQDEVIELEDVRTGISITDLGLNEFRMDLLNYIKTYGDLGNMPNGMHAVVPSKTELGLQPGVIFTLRSLNVDADINQQNRLHPYYLIYINLNGELVHNQTEVKRLLDLVRTCCKGQVKPITDVCQRFNSATSDGRKMQVYSDLLSRSIRSMIDVKEEKDLDSLFSGGKTTALTNTIAGLDDFELISFIVVQDEQ
ncbi:MAG: DEAD/DEAH box helicase family protein [Thiotrichales bacterium]|nr:MAG: DEAD/DEAH box helicase family protein [Thiotrichales bacterium]